MLTRTVTKMGTQAEVCGTSRYCWFLQQHQHVLNIKLDHHQQQHPLLNIAPHAPNIILDPHHQQHQHDHSYTYVLFRRTYSAQVMVVRPRLSRVRPLLCPLAKS